MAHPTEDLSRKTGKDPKGPAEGEAAPPRPGGAPFTVAGSQAADRAGDRGPEAYARDVAASERPENPGADLEGLGRQDQQVEAGRG